jgi:small-conductance mechanosensitive channel
MKSPRWLPFLVLGLAVAAAGAGWYLTRPLPPPPATTPASEPGLPAPGGHPGATAGKGKGKGKDKAVAKGPVRVQREWVVDEGPLQTARALEPLAATPEEKQFAHQAQRVGNHEVDLAYNDALRNALENPPQLTPEAEAALADKKRQEAEVKTDQEQIAQLTRKLAAAKEPEAAQAQLDMARAQLELDQDELDQAAETLERLGGDTQARIRRLQAAHAGADQAPPAVAPASAFFQNGSLLGKLKAWTDARSKTRTLAAAQKEALDKQQVLGQRRDRRAQRVAKEQEARQEAKEVASAVAQSRAADIDVASSKEMTDSLKHYVLDQQMLADLGRRMQDLQEQAEIYGSWGLLAETQQRAALHSLILGSGAILVVLALVLAAETLFNRLFLRLMQQDNRRVGRMLKVVRFATLAVGVVAILFIVFGLPSQMTTLFGLAGAGLTVALKDFIVAFFGWFVLVGRNGIHVGDWVEINGVGGEVVEIGLLRTMLMETGNWNDLGHPTGRIVSFVNSFAIERHFFNFSTSGQWMWDEVQTLVPAGQDPYALAEAIRARVEQETAANAQRAESEWQAQNRQHRAPGFSARPDINVVPAASGVEIRVRYITRAFERQETRGRLNQAMVELLHGPKEPAIGA